MKWHKNKLKKKHLYGVIFSRWINFFIIFTVDLVYMSLSSNFISVHVRSAIPLWYPSLTQRTANHLQPRWTEPS